MKLKFKTYQFRVKEEDGKRYIFDIVRKKFLQITPEEWVRQNLLHYLIDSCAYPLNLLAVEKKVVFGELDGRIDILLYDRELKPWMVLECKAPEVKLSQAVFDQVSRYNIALKAPYLIICNGPETEIAEINFEDRKISFLDDWPVFPEAEPKSQA